MPMKRKMIRTRKTVARKPVTYKKAKNVVAKRTKVAKKSATDTHTEVFKIEYAIGAQQGTLVDNYIYQNYNMWDQLMNSVQFNTVRMRYSRFRANSMLVTWKPKYNVVNVKDTITDPSNNNLTTSGDGLIHTIVSRDSVAPKSLQGFITAASYKKHSIFKPFSRKYKVSYPKSTWLDCQDPQETIMQGTRKGIGLYGCVSIYAENLPERKNQFYNDIWATSTIYIAVVFQGLLPMATTYDPESGSITMKPYTLTGLSETPKIALSGTLEGDKIITGYTDASGILVEDRPVEGTP